MSEGQIWEVLHPTASQPPVCGCCGFVLFADPEVAGKLSGPVAGLSSDLQGRFRAQVIALPDGIQVCSMRDLSCTMAVLRERHRSEGRGMSAAMVEALASAHQLNAGIAVSASDFGPNLRDSAIADGIAFHTL